MMESSLWLPRALSKGATVSISGSVADDGTVFNAIVWAIQAGGMGELAILRAYDALADGTLTELYDSNQSGLRDQMGCGMKFSVPTVANGKVYVGTGPAPAFPAPRSARGSSRCLDCFDVGRLMNRPHGRGSMSPG